MLFVISYTDTLIIDTLFIFTGFIVLVPVMSILVSCTFDLASILMIHSAKGRYKAFSTCASHQDVDKVASLLYTVVTPMLNP